jgi:hypothetical protein
MLKVLLVTPLNIMTIGEKNKQADVLSKPKKVPSDPETPNAHHQSNPGVIGNHLAPVPWDLCRRLDLERLCSMSCY